MLNKIEHCELVNRLMLVTNFDSCGVTVGREQHSRGGVAGRGEVQ